MTQTPSTPSDNDPIPKRSIRSFVLRQSHMTPAQQKAIDTLWPQFGLDFQAATVDLNTLFGHTAPKILEIGFDLRPFRHFKAN